MHRVPMTQAATPVDAGVEEVEADVDPAQVVAPHQLLRDRLELVA